ncbi:MAG: DHH family phosphoesterase, partial [Gemella morbillorum]|nr:DHH family phosphoesterase [Gemella morbillorum]
MNAKRKYEIVIFTLYTIGAIIIGLMNLISLAVYLVVGLSVFMLFYYYKKKVSEQTEKYISKLTNRIKDSTEKGINKFPIGIIVID